MNRQTSGTTSFKIDKVRPTKNEELRIYLVYSYKGERWNLYSGYSIESKYWDAKKERTNSKHVHHSSINNSLSCLKQRIDVIRSKAIALGISPTVSYVKREYGYAQKGGRETDFIELFKMFIEFKSHKVSVSTVRIYNETLAHIRRVKNLYSVELNIDLINHTTYEKFSSYLSNDCGFRSNTVGKYIKTLKTFLQWCVENEYTQNLKFKKFDVVSEDIDNIFLTEAEIKRIEDLQFLPEQRTLSIVRDLFVLGCWTGLRNSDWSLIDSQSLFTDNDGNLFLEVLTKKTSEKVTLPVFDIVKRIIEKYNGKIPFVHNQTLNKNLKAIGKLAGLTEEVSVNIGLSKNNDRFERMPKYMLLTTHTARRSFATNMYLKGVPVISIMNLTGHKTEKSFRSYIKLTKLDHAKIVLEKNKPILKVAC